MQKIHEGNQAIGEAIIDSTNPDPKERNYKRAKLWEIGFFAANNSATNIFMFLMMNVAYYATGVAGLGTVIVSTLITASRIFDGFTDPIIGLWIDKTDGKFGKFRPFMLAGYLIMTVITLLLFFTTHQIPQQFRLVYFIVLYVIYIIGYTFQTACTKSGQSVITNDPKQRPIFSAFDISMTSLIFAGAGIYLSTYLVPKYGSFNSAELFYEFNLTFIAIAGILTFLAILGISSSDRTEYFGTGEPVKITFKDMWRILKGNRPLQMLIIAASTDKLGGQIAGNSIVMVMLFGIVIGDYALFGALAGITLIPSVLIALFGTGYASRMGTKKAYVVFTWLAIIVYTGILLLLTFGDPTTIRLGNWSFVSISFILLYVAGAGLRVLSGGLVIPMIPDVTDYETYKTGRYAPGVMGTIFSFVDKIVSSFAQTLIGLSLALIGFTEIFPDVGTPFSPEIKWITIALFIGVMIIAWIASLVAMKYYELDRTRMMEIQNELADRREAVQLKKQAEGF
ncbi:MFS transporter [Jeotgalibaca sp. MA1X17-3]|uniref:MFS transporter n=1 Tax=Jeotgalibaca sp. MA1X17-3 TaxID=2908211 RepID=UPI001F2153ED|nr:MFS transporter [Jeotgalibaca sp. MA1X17-3]UJF16182.1 MFS transporter [Jeotgalibaca sp. MA1X17-3]